MQGCARRCKLTTDSIPFTRSRVQDKNQEEDDFLSFFRAMDILLYILLV